MKVDALGLITSDILIKASREASMAAPVAVSTTVFLMLVIVLLAALAAFFSHALSLLPIDSVWTPASASVERIFTRRSTNWSSVSISFNQAGAGFFSA